MLIQLQFEDIATGETEFVAQMEFVEGVHNHSDITDWTAEIRSRYLLPRGKRWLLCNEKARQFKRQGE